ncbi:MAG: hypothetical protein JWO06_4066 [Bacteroidota bacterium]|nr:hypothetical protein [Bacteroidota bacterium]
MFLRREKTVTILKILVALLLASASSIMWFYYGCTIYNDHITSKDFLFYGFYPAGLGISAILASLIFDGNLQGVGLRSTQAKYIGTAALLSLVLTVLPFALNLFLYLTGLNLFPEIYAQLLLYLFPGLVILSIAEEVMWRGILFTSFSQFFNFSTTSIIIGLLWAAWHFPIIIHSKLLYSDRPLVFSLIMFTVLTVASSFIYNYLRAVSRSIWPCVVLHTLQNFFFYTLIGPTERSVYPWSSFFMNDIGLLYVLAALAGALYFGSRGRKLLSGNKFSQ